MFTGVDNQTWGIGRILWAKMCIVYCAVSVYHAVQHGVFDPQNWAIGASAILAGGGGDSGNVGGVGGNYGGGGGGGGQDVNNGYPGAAGTQGFLVITYTATSGFWLFF